MKFNPIKRTLYTESGEFITKLNCPYKVSLADTDNDNPVPDHICNICNGEIVETIDLDEKELLSLSKNEVNLCFKIDPTQRNIRIVYSA